MEADAGAGRDIHEGNVGARIVSGGIWRVAAFLLATLMAVLSTSIIAHELGPGPFGELTTGLSLVSITAAIADLGLLQLGVREFTEQPPGARERSQRALITLRLGFTIIVSAAILAVSVIRGASGDFVGGLAIACLGLCFFSLQVSYTVPLQANYKLNGLAAVDTLRQVLASGLMIAVAVTSGSVGGILATYLPVGIVIALATAWLARGLGAFAPSLDFPEMRRMMRDVGAFAIAASVGTVYGYAAQVISHSVLSSDASGQFALAFRVYSVLVAGCMVAVGGAFPLLVAAAKEDLERMVFASRRLFQTSLLTGLVCAVGLVTGAQVVVDVLGGSEFRDAAPLVQIVGAAVPFSFLLITGSTVLLATRRHRALVTISLSGAAVSIAATALLAEAFGARGAAAGLLAGELLLCAGYLAVVHRDSSRALPRAGWALTVTAAAAFSCLAALLPVPALVAAAIGLAVFAGIVIVGRLAPPELLERLPV